MQPWKVSAGLTTTLAGLPLLLLGSHLEYLAPFWNVILADYQPVAKSGFLGFMFFSNAGVEMA